MSIIYGIISALLDSICESYRKKAIDNAKMPDGLIALIGPIIGIFVIYTLILFFGINYNIFFDKSVIILLLIYALIDGFGSLLEVKIVKNIKISKIMPYTSTDKLFIILIGFLFFYGNPGYTSIITLIVTILTIIIIILFSLDYRNLTIEKNVKLYIFLKFLNASSTLILGKILFEYSTLDIFALIIFLIFGFHFFLKRFQFTFKAI